MTCCHFLSICESITVNWFSVSLLGKLIQLSQLGSTHLRLSSIQSLRYVWLFADPWTTACQASLSISHSQSLLKFMPIKSVMLLNLSSSVVPFSSCLQFFPASGSFPMSWFFASGSQSIGVSALASVFPMNIQDWFPFRGDWLDHLAIQGTISFKKIKTKTL